MSGTDVRVNYRAIGPNGTTLYWSTIGPPEKIEELAALEARKLGVQEYSAPRADSTPNDWGWAFEPEVMRRKEEAAARAATIVEPAKEAQAP